LFFYTFITKKVYICSKKTSSPIWGGCNKAVLTNDTGTLDTLNYVLLAEAIDKDKRKDYQKSAGIGDTVIVKSLSYEGRISKTSGHLNYLCDQVVTLVGEEQTGIEGICPLPSKAEDEYCDHHRNAEGKDYTDERLENA